MVKILKQGSIERNAIEVSLEVVPNSKQFKVIGYNQWTNSLRIKTGAKAMKGMANGEIAKQLEKIFKAKAEIISGQAGRKKA